VPRQLARACLVAFALGDDDALGDLAGTCAATSREQGAFQVLPEALDYLGVRELRAGSLSAAADLFTEAIELDAVLRRRTGPGHAGRLIVSAWRGNESEVRTGASAAAAEAGHLGLVVRWSRSALLLLELGLGNYESASSSAPTAFDHDVMLGAL